MNSESALTSSLQKHFGFSEFRSGQEQTISQLVNGQSSLAIFPTGSGKSLCYQLAALHLPHLTLVVSPLLALMQDQLTFLAAHNIKAASLDSTLTHQEYQRVVSELKRGEIKVLMVSVERFKNERFRQLIEAIPISMMVVDEAHCISEWGHNFRPDYLKLPLYRQDLNIPLVLLLTATATRKVKQDMADKFGINAEHIVQTGFYRPNLNLEIVPCADADKLPHLLNFIGTQRGSGIVYVTLQNQAEELAAQLAQQGISAQAYHAGLGNEQRQRIQHDFMSSNVQIIVATIAFGMGVDKSDIRFVVHYQLPKSIENYSQEIGRAGRDGQAAHCLTYANLDGINTLENFVYGDTPERWSLEQLIQTIKNETEKGQWHAQAHTVSFSSNIRILTLKTLIVQLELMGLLTTKYTYFSEYRLKFLQEPEAILGQFKGERVEFLAAIFAQCQRKKVWADLNIGAVEQAYKTDRGRVLTALDYLQEQGLIELQTKGAVDVYEVNEQALARTELVDELEQGTRSKEASEILRINQLIQFFNQQHCITGSLAGYFDDQNAPECCGHCSVCLGQYQPLVAYQTAPVLDAQQLQPYLHELQQNLTEKLNQYGIVYTLNEKLASHYLVGLTTPWFTRFRFRQLRGFAKAECYRYEQVREQVKRLL